MSLSSASGPFIISGHIAAFLSGMLMLQLCVYFVLYPRDHRHTRFTVAVVGFTDLILTIAGLVIVYRLVTTSDSLRQDPLQAQTIPLSLKIVTPFNSIPYVAFAIIFTHRIKIICWYNLTLYRICWALNMLRAAAYVVGIWALFSRIKTLSDTRRMLWVLTSVTTVFALGDMFMMGALSYTLWRRRKVSHPGTKSAVRIIVLALTQAGLSLALASTVIAICILSLPENWVWLSMFLFHSKIYSNTLLASLNCRATLKNITQQHEVVLTQISSGDVLEFRVTGIEREGRSNVTGRQSIVDHPSAAASV